MQRSTKKIKPEVDYRQFRFKKMNTPEFSHVKLLLFWPFFGLMFMFLERFQPERPLLRCTLCAGRLDPILGMGADPVSSVVCFSHRSTYLYLFL